MIWMPFRSVLLNRSLVSGTDSGPDKIMLHWPEAGGNLDLLDQASAAPLTQEE